MVHLSSAAKILDLVISAIRNLRELKGSTSREILRYISSLYNIPIAMARRQMQNALKRGVAYGILKKAGGHYSLPTDSGIARQEVAMQEIGLLDLYCQRKVHRTRGRVVRRGRRAGRKVACRCTRKSARRTSRGCEPRSSKMRRGMGRRRRRRSRRCGEGFGKRTRDADGTAKSSRIELVSEETDGLIELDPIATEVVGVEQSRPSVEQRNRDVPVSC